VLYPETDYEQHEDIQNIEMHSDDSSKVSSLKITSHLPKVCRHKQARDAEAVLVDIMCGLLPRPLYRCSSAGVSEDGKTTINL
jgi:hypothetical protein